MNEVIIEEISKDLNISKKQVMTVLKLLEEGNTIPFIARYRKEATGALNEEVIKSIDDVYQYQVNLMKRKEDVIRLIDEKGLLTDELKTSIMKCTKLVEVDDLYRPYKEKKKTKATDAINNGLEPLAKIIMSCPVKGDINTIASNYLNDKVKSVEDAVMGAKYIIAEWITDNAYYRKWIRSYIFKEGVVVSKLKKNAEDENKIYSNYYDFSEAVKVELSDAKKEIRNSTNQAREENKEYKKIIDERLASNDELISKYNKSINAMTKGITSLFFVIVMIALVSFVTGPIGEFFGVAHLYQFIQKFIDTHETPWRYLIGILYLLPYVCFAGIMWLVAKTLDVIRQFYI